VKKSGLYILVKWPISKLYYMFFHVLFILFPLF